MIITNFKIVAEVLAVVLATVSSGFESKAENSNFEEPRSKMYCRCKQGQCLAGNLISVYPLCWEGQNVDCHGHDAVCQLVQDPEE